jgi:hypothetical protein
MNIGVALVDAVDAAAELRAAMRPATNAAEYRHDPTTHFLLLPAMPLCCWR